MVSDAERSLREDLAGVHGLISWLNMDFLTWNHASVRVAGEGGFLVTPGNVTYDGVTPENLELGSVNVTANVIHEAIYSGREDVGAVIHTHTPAVVTIGALRKGLQFLTSDSTMFWGSVAYYDWLGVSDSNEEAEDIRAACADPSVNVLFMRNHGVCTFGSTIQDAFVRAYLLERACQAELDVLKTRLPIHRIKDEATTAMAQYSQLVQPGSLVWEPLRQFIARQVMGQSATKPHIDISESEQVQLLRKDLALAHQLIFLYGMDNLTYNFVSGRLPPNTDAAAEVQEQELRFLTSPGDRMFDDVQPQHLVLNTSDNWTVGLSTAIYTAMPHINAVVYLRSPAVLALSVLEYGMDEFLEQDAVLFYERVSYHELSGRSDANEEELAAVRESLRPGCTVLMLRNRGACAMGRSVAEAWVTAFYLERTGRNFLEAKATGEELVLPSATLVKETLDLVERSFRPGDFEWEPVRKMAAHFGIQQRRRLADTRI